MKSEPVTEREGIEAVVSRPAGSSYLDGDEMNR